MWIEKERLILLRMIKQENGQKEEGIFEDHIRTGKGWTNIRLWTLTHFQSASPSS
ncbi:MAG: hypothetical protein SH848_04800 [Saprospiraceae bacterium]|nr:hypothetical protein [Saprospiraceae bacterium]MDZ4703223.1 hypothetical protein [Saprospiraceae bacterium]